MAVILRYGYGTTSLFGCPSEPWFGTHILGISGRGLPWCHYRGSGVRRGLGVRNALAIAVRLLQRNRTQTCQCSFCTYAWPGWVSLGYILDQVIILLLLNQMIKSSWVIFPWHTSGSTLSTLQQIWGFVCPSCPLLP